MEKVRERIREAFEEADIDGDGELNRDQLTLLMRKMKREIIGEDTDPRPAAIDWVMQLADRSGDGALNLREVEKAISIYAGYLQERDFIDGIFEKYDKNKDQVLDRDELRGYCTELNEGVEPTEAEMDWIISRADKGGMTSKAGDGKIGRIELLAVVNEWFFMPPEINDDEFEDGDEGQGTPKGTPKGKTKPPPSPKAAFSEEKKKSVKKTEAESGCCVVQ
jgi:Ca2+-binding EF-hand superfamily protein